MQERFEKGIILLIQAGKGPLIQGTSYASAVTSEPDPTPCARISLKLSKLIWGGFEK